MRSISFFGARGFVQLGRVVDDGELARLRADADALGGAIHHDPWRRMPAFAALIATRAAPAAVETARAPLRLFQDHLIVKRPARDPAIDWHQDYSYWPLDAPAGVTMWIALDDADADNGCLVYQPGTHRLGERRAADFTAGASMPRRADLPPLEPDLRAAIAMPARAGHAIAHDPLVWHMSPPNRTERPRRAWSITWIAPHVRWDPAHAPHPFTTMSSLRRGDELSTDRFPVFPA